MSSLRYKMGMQKEKKWGKKDFSYDFFFSCTLFSGYNNHYSTKGGRATTLRTSNRHHEYNNNEKIKMKPFT